MRKNLTQKAIAAVLIIGSVFLIITCSENRQKPRGIRIAKSKTYEASLYRQNCAVCHGLEAYGKEVNGQQVPSLRFGNVENKTEQELYDQIANGKHPMPSFKDQLTDEDIWRLVKFIRRDLQGKEN